MKRKIAIGLCIFLTIAPFLGSFVTNKKAGLIVRNLFPYIHLSIAQDDGLPFADGIAALFALLTSTLGLFGFITVITTKKQHTIGLKTLLVITIVYCGLRALGGLLDIFMIICGFETIPILLVVGIVTDFAWIFFCYWAGNNLNASHQK